MNANDRKKVYESLMDRPIAFHRIFKTITGSTVAAVFLSQVYYWSKNKTAISRGGWFIKTCREWEEETGLTRYEQETARRTCKDLGLIVEKLQRWNKHATLHFRLNDNRLFELVEKSSSLGKSNKLIDCGNPTNYSLGKSNKLYTETTQRLPPKEARRGIFKTWKDTPEKYHPFFQACINHPFSLPEPTPSEIKAWLKTFDEWILKGFSSKQITAAAAWARDKGKNIPYPKSITYALNNQHAHATIALSHGNNESVIAQLARNQRKI